ncbi:MAG: glucan 1,4-alpha-glucosidase, partial [Nitrososphaerota archaeon]|nr:glucan 1,4-alpha-glucosidase [Nitrososphaerota archaeon]
VWDEEDREDLHLLLGKPTGSAMPLAWAHAEYIKLLRSSLDKKVFDVIPAVSDRYIRNRSKCKDIELWKPNRQPRAVRRGFIFRVQAPSSFRLHWTSNEWKQTNDTLSTQTALAIKYVDIPVLPSQESPIRFTFYWTNENRWEGRDYEVSVVSNMPNMAIT